MSRNGDYIDSTALMYTMQSFEALLCSYNDMANFESSVDGTTCLLASFHEIMRVSHRIAAGIMCNTLGLLDHLEDRVASISERVSRVPTVRIGVFLSG